MTPFEIDRRLPFQAQAFAVAVRKAHRESSPDRRRECDFLAAFGTEMHPDKNGVFQDSRLRMVRSGDSNGQGLPVYARTIRQATTRGHLDRTLFRPWDYRDTGFSLRWSPLEDQRYALRWQDPSKSTLNDGPGTMLGANSLAVEALQLLPTYSVGKRAATTGFQRSAARELLFVWPIWTPPIGLDLIRSLVGLPMLAERPLPRERLAAMGIPEVYCSQRIAKSQYYNNLAPAVPA